MNILLLITLTIRKLLKNLKYNNQTYNEFIIIMGQLIII